MSRPLRIEIKGGVYHVMTRGNAKSAIFIDDGDRIRLIDILAKTVAVHRWYCHAYCLMNNHYHLLIETPEANLASGMHLLNGMYTQGFNKLHGRTGHVFEGRYKSILVEKERYLLELIRYIVLNPVRAGMVEKPGEYRWSSYSATSGAIEVPGFLHTSWILEQFQNSRKNAIESYIEFIHNSGEPPKDVLETNTPIIGSESFRMNMIPYLTGAGKDREIPREQRLVARPSLEELFKDKSPLKAERNRLIVSAFMEYGYTQKEIAVQTGLHYTTISRLIDSRIEKC
ncbi:MAG: addiction module toxin RelE [Chlorobiaceae bacterium]|nr:addiction module toxin RelE [Chlorobiaceae bacterium]